MTGKASHKHCVRGPVPHTVGTLFMATKTEISAPRGPLWFQKCYEYFTNLSMRKKPFRLTYGRPNWPHFVQDSDVKGC